MTRRATAARRGMTLMELLVATSITGMTTAAGYAAFASVIDHRRALRESTAEAERGAALRATLDAWLAAGRVQVRVGGGPTAGASGGAAARSPAVGQGAPAVAAAAAVDADAELTLVTDAPNPAGTPTARVRVYVDADPDTPERGLAVEYQASTQAPLGRRELDAMVTGMLVEFLDQRTRRWLPASQGATLSPMAVRITLAGSDAPGTAPLPAILRLPIVRATTDQPLALTAPAAGSGR